MKSAIQINNYTDPMCPFAYSAEPIRLRLKWLYGSQLEFKNIYIVLSGINGEVSPITPEVAAKYQTSIRDKYQMPMEVVVRTRKVESVLACRNLIAAELHDGDRVDIFLRNLRIAAMTGAYLDEDDVIRKIAKNSGIDVDSLAEWCKDPSVEEELLRGFESARQPKHSAKAFSHKLSKTSTDIQRYSAPSYQFIQDNKIKAELPGFWPVEAYEAIIGNMLPDIKRKENPGNVAEVLKWANMPMATAEVAMICQKAIDETKDELDKIAVKNPIGQDGFWVLK